MKTFRCFKQIDVTRFAILLCVALLFLTVVGHRNKVVYRFSYVHSTPYRHAVIQNTEVEECWALNALGEEVIDKLENNEVARKAFFSQLAARITKELGVAVRTVEIRDKKLLCVSYAYSSKGSSSRSPLQPRFY